MASSKKTASKTPGKVPTINFGDGDGGPGPLPNPTNIGEAIVAIMDEVGYVRKSKGAQLSYTYAEEAQLIAAVRPWMVHYGVFMNVTDIRDVNEQDRPRERGGNTRLVSLTSGIRFTHAASGTFIDVVARGEGADVSDKANNKAQTCAFKYAIRQTFCLETGDDPDRTNPAVPQGSRTGALANPAQAEEDPWAWSEQQGPPPEAEMAEPPAPPDTKKAPAPDDKKASTPKPKLAQVHISAGPVRVEYDKWIQRLITRYPAYSLQKQGQPTELPDLNHIRATAVSLNYAEITDANYQDVLQAIAKHAAEKSGTPAPAPDKPKATSGGPAKRPTNDEALKRAGF